MKRNTPSAVAIRADAGLERILLLEQQLAPTPVHSPKHRRLTAAIRVEAIAYRKSLDAAQTAATYDMNPERAARKRAGKK